MTLEAAILKNFLTQQNRQYSSERPRLTGSIKRTFVLPLPDNFDEPLEEFEDYM